MEAFDRLRDPKESDHNAEEAVIDLVRDAIQEAFRRIEPLQMLYLRLVYCHGVTKRDLAMVSHCHESTVGRELSRAVEEIRRIILSEIQASDPDLVPTWEDFQEVCQKSLSFAHDQ